MNWKIILLIGIAALVLIVFLVVKNVRDARKLKKQIQDDYPKPRDEEGDIEIDETMK